MAISTIGIISAGDMGAAIGNVLTHGGIDVITPLAGRSQLSLARAAESGMCDAGTVEGLVREADVVLSVLVVIGVTWYVRSSSSKSDPQQ